MREIELCVDIDRPAERVLQGTAWFELRPLGEGRAQLVWREALTLPFGAVGRLLGPFLSVGTRAVIALALRRFARWVVREAARG